MITITPDRTVLTGRHGFDPVQTFTCGQCFRFTPMRGGFSGIAGGREIFVSGTLSETVLYCQAEDFTGFWRGYFDLDRPYHALRRLAKGDPFLEAASEFGSGIRLLRQEAFEALCSFILSQCNNIPRISAIVERMAVLFGARTKTGYAFPTPAGLAAHTLDELASLKAGYRTPYILAAAKAVAHAELDLGALADPSLPLEQARLALMALPGVGRKVADCVLLFGLGRMDAFPVDVWMRRALAQHYPEGFAPERFPQAAGLFQQYMFFYIRHLSKAEETARK